MCQNDPKCANAYLGTFGRLFDCVWLRQTGSPLPREDNCWLDRLPKSNESRKCSTSDWDSPCHSLSMCFSGIGFCCELDLKYYHDCAPCVDQPQENQRYLQMIWEVSSGCPSGYTPSLQPTLCRTLAFPAPPKKQFNLSSTPPAPVPTHCCQLPSFRPSSKHMPEHCYPVQHPGTHWRSPLSAALPRGPRSRPSPWKKSAAMRSHPSLRHIGARQENTHLMASNTMSEKCKGPFKQNTGTVYSVICLVVEIISPGRHAVKIKIFTILESFIQSLSLSPETVTHRSRASFSLDDPNWRGLPWKHKPYSTRFPCSVKRCPSHVVGLHCPEHLANHNMVLFYIRYILNPTSGFPNFTTDKTILGLAVRGNSIGHPGNLDFCPFPLQTLRLFTKHLRSCWWNCPIFPDFWWWDFSGSLKK